MLKINLKRIKENYTRRRIEKFINMNFFELRTTDILSLNEIMHEQTHTISTQADMWVASFKDKQSVFSLALTMVRRQFGSDITANEVFSNVKYFDAFWEFARRIADYKGEQKTMSRRSKRRWNKKTLTTHK